MEIAQRFFGKVDFAEGCWEWLGAKYSNGYGTFSIKKKAKMAHRVAYELCQGDIPVGFVIDHLCDNPSCVKPEHLRTCSQKDNVRRGKAKITSCPLGHEYTPQTTYIRPRGGRECRPCRNIHAERSRLKKLGRDFHWNGEWKDYSK